MSPCSVTLCGVQVDRRRTHSRWPAVGRAEAIDADAARPRHLACAPSPPPRPDLICNPTPPDSARDERQPLMCVPCWCPSLLLKTLGLPDVGQPVLTRRRPPSAVLRHQRASCSTATTASFPATNRSTGPSCAFPASERCWPPSSPFGFSLSAGSRLADGWARPTRLTPLLSDRLPSARSTYAQGSNDLKVQANGDGGLEEVADEFRDGR
jgi:hypothetical protein